MLMSNALWNVQLWMILRPKRSGEERFMMIQINNRPGYHSYGTTDTRWNSYSVKCYHLVIIWSMLLLCPWKHTNNCAQSAFMDRELSARTNRKHHKLCTQCPVCSVLFLQCLATLALSPSLLSLFSRTHDVQMTPSLSSGLLTLTLTLLMTSMHKASLVQGHWHIYASSILDL